MSIKDSLAFPQLYQAFQVAGGFYGARLAAIRRYLRLKPGQRVIDIGCGPGYLARDLPAGLDYFGFDVDRRYIEFAKSRFVERGKFFCCEFDHAASRSFGPADVAMMNGVLHHLSDNDAMVTLSAIQEVLRPGGALFTLDGAYTEPQRSLSRFLLDHDRGRHVRTPEQYLNLLRSAFTSVESHIHDDLTRVPYTLFIAISRKMAA